MADSDPASAVPSGTASPKEDAATKSAREDLKHTVISEKADAADAAENADETSDHAFTPDTTPQLKPGQHDALREDVSSPKKKRAHDQVDDDDTTATEGNKKNKDEHDQNNDDADTSAVTAATATIAASTTPTLSAADASNSSAGAEPNKKRLRDETAGDANDAKDSADGKDAKRPAAAPASAFASSGFAKLVSTASPFGALGGGGAATKPSLFGASTANTTASSSASPFGSSGAVAAKSAIAGTSATLSFGGSGSASPFAGLQSSAPSSNVFGSAFGGASAASSTGFGGIGGGSGSFGGAAGASSVFGSALSGPKLTSFAKPGEAFKSDKPARPFGAPESEPEESGEEDSAAEEDENGDEGEGDEAGAETEEKTKTSGEDKKKRLQRVVIDDGETGEATLLQVRARMYYHDKDLGWKERGAGMLKVNVPEQCVEFDRDGNVIPASFDASTLGGDADADDNGAGGADAADDAGSDDANGSKSDIGASAKPKAGSGLAALPRRTMVRLIMRQDSTHRVILNTFVLATTEFKDRQTLKATTVLFTAFEGPEAKPVAVQAKMNIANAKTFLSAIEGIQKELRGE